MAKRINAYFKIRLFYVWITTRYPQQANVAILKAFDSKLSQFFILFDVSR